MDPTLKCIFLIGDLIKKILGKMITKLYLKVSDVKDLFIFSYKKFKHKWELALLNIKCSIVWKMRVKETEQKKMSYSSRDNLKFITMLVLQNV